MVSYARRPPFTLPLVPSVQWLWGIHSRKWMFQVLALSPAEAAVNSMMPLSPALPPAPGIRCPFHGANCFSPKSQLRIAKANDALLSPSWHLPQLINKSFRAALTTVLDPSLFSFLSPGQRMRVPRWSVSLCQPRPSLLKKTEGPNAWLHHYFHFAHSTFLLWSWKEKCSG